MAEWIDNLKQRLVFPAEAKRAIERDREPVPPRPDPGIDDVIDCGLRWIAVAQDHSASRDGGVARHYSVLKGWGESYPETTGYIVPTCIHFARVFGRRDLDQRARRMLDWLVSIQMPGGGFQGGMVSAVPKVPVTFNTGQILMGLAAGTAAYGEAYAASMRQAADWLATTIDRTVAGAGTVPRLPRRAKRPTRPTSPGGCSRPCGSRRTRSGSRLRG